MLVAPASGEEMKKIIIWADQRWKIVDEPEAARLVDDCEVVLVVDADELLASLCPDGIEITERIKRALSEIELIRDSLICSAKNASDRSEIKQAEADGYNGALKIIQAIL